MKLWAMPCRATQNVWVIVKNSDRTWSTGGGNGKPLQYSSCKNPHKQYEKAERYDTGRWAPPRLEGVQYTTGEEQRAIIGILKFFWMWLPYYSRDICSEAYPFPTEYSWHLCQTSIDHICVNLFLNSILSHVYLYKNTTLFWKL